MKKKSPNHRFLAVKAAKKAPTGASEKQLYMLLHGGKANSTVARAHDIYTHVFKRETLESLLFAQVSPQEVFEIVRVPVAVTTAYCELFFDTSVFEDDLDKLEYARTYTQNAYGEELKLFAVDMGAEALKVRLSRGQYVVSAELAEDSIRSTSFLLTQLAKTNPADSDITKESHRWAQLCLKALGDRNTDNDDVGNFRIALEKHDVTENEEKSGIPPDEILH